MNNLPGVALDSGEARIRTRDLLIATPASQPLSNRATQFIELNFAAHQTVQLMPTGGLKIYPARALPQSIDGTPIIFVFNYILMHPTHNQQRIFSDKVVKYVTEFLGWFIGVSAG